MPSSLVCMVGVSLLLSTEEVVLSEFVDLNVISVSRIS